MSLLPRYTRRQSHSAHETSIESRANEGYPFIHSLPEATAVVFADQRANSFERRVSHKDSRLRVSETRTVCFEAQDGLIDCLWKQRVELLGSKDQCIIHHETRDSRYRRRSPHTRRCLCLSSPSLLVACCCDTTAAQDDEGRVGVQKALQQQLLLRTTTMMTTRKQSQEQTEATQDKSRGSSCERLTRATLCSRKRGSHCFLLQKIPLINLMKGRCERETECKSQMKQSERERVLVHSPSLISSNSTTGGFRAKERKRKSQASVDFLLSCFFASKQTVKQSAQAITPMHGCVSRSSDLVRDGIRELGIR